MPLQLVVEESKHNLQFFGSTSLRSMRLNLTLNYCAPTPRYVSDLCSEIEESCLLTYHFYLPKEKRTSICTLGPGKFCFGRCHGNQIPYLVGDHTRTFYVPHR
jgi:hypothetical protein